MKRIFGSVLLLVSDIIAFYVSLFLAFLTKYLFFIDWLKTFESKKEYFIHRYIIEFWWIIPVYLFFIAMERLYSRRVPFWIESKLIVKSIFIAFLVTNTVIYIAGIERMISQYMYLAFFMYAVFIFPLFRFIIKNIAHMFNLVTEDVIVVGAGTTGLLTLKEITKEKYLGYNVIGLLDDNKKENIKLDNKEYPILGKLDDFGNIIEKYNLKSAIFAISSMPKDEIANKVAKFQKYVKELIVVPDLRGISIMNTELYYLFSEQIFFLNVKNNLQSGFNKFVKRGFDVLLSVFLFPFLIPLIFVFGIIIKLDSKGSIFYKQKRMGKDGKEFFVYKFRSMYNDADKRLKDILNENPEMKKEWEKNFKLKNDPRVTRVGKFLRKTSLDELPQFFNVLKGDMSFVGPRPVLKKEIEMFYGDYADFYYSVTPGITGLWQVSGRSDTDYEFRVRSDAWYVLNWSLWLDIIILVKTVRVVLKREGAY